MKEKDMSSQNLWTYAEVKVTKKVQRWKFQKITTLEGLDVVEI